MSAEVQELVLDGRLGEAIRTTQLFYPDLLENNLELLFVLRCRQFIEIVNGTEGESVPLDCSLPCIRRALCVKSPRQSGRTADLSLTTVNVGSPVATSHRPPSCDTSQRLTSSQAVLATDTERLTNGAPLNLSASSMDKNLSTQNGATHDGDALAEHDSDMDTSDNDDRSLANGSSAQCLMNGSSELSKYGNLRNIFDSDDGDDDGVDLDTVMGKHVNYCCVVTKQNTRDVP